MRRRTLLSTVAGLAALGGCVATRPSADPPPGTTTATTATTTTTATTPDCDPVATDLDPPPVEKPDPLDAEGALAAAYEVESYYLAVADTSPGAIPEVPDDVDRFQFSPSEACSEATRAGDGFDVRIRAMARYSDTGSGEGETAYHADRPIDAATYRVTDRRLRRERGIGDLEGTVVCW